MLANAVGVSCGSRASRSCSLHGCRRLIYLTILLSGSTGGEVEAGWLPGRSRALVMRVGSQLWPAVTPGLRPSGLIGSSRDQFSSSFHGNMAWFQGFLIPSGVVFCGTWPARSSTFRISGRLRACGEVAESVDRARLEIVVRVIPSWVRIPPSPFPGNPEDCQDVPFSREKEASCL